MEIGSKSSIKVLIVAIAVLYTWLMCFMFGEDVGLGLKIAGVLAGLFYIYKVIDVFSLCIKIEDGYLKIRSIIPRTRMVSVNTINSRDFAFLISDIQTISVEYKQAKDKLGFQDPYLGKGRPMLVVKSKDIVTEVFLDSFDVKEVEKFVQLILGTNRFQRRTTPPTMTHQPSKGFIIALIIILLPVIAFKYWQWQFQTCIRSSEKYVLNEYKEYSLVDFFDEEPGTIYFHVETVDGKKFNIEANVKCDFLGKVKSLETVN